jgi:hypothetical protein
LISRTAFSVDNEYRFIHDRPLSKNLPPVYLVENRPGGVHGSLSQIYSSAVEAGKLTEILQLVADAVPGLVNILNLTEAGGGSVVHLVFSDHSIPVALAGDGIQSLVRLCIELGALTGGTALLEEPEAHQHPRAVYQSARAITAAVRRNIQVILTTHSLELIDALLGELKDDEIDQLSVFRIGNAQGALKVSRYAGTDVAFARQEIGEDLR